MPEAILRTDEQVIAFCRDWLLPMPLLEMAAMHGFADATSVSRAARRLGLPRRSQRDRREREFALTNGRWVLDPKTRIQVWESAA